MDQTIKVFCLSSFTEDEMDDILAELSDSDDQYSDIQLISWDYEEDGSQEDVFRIFNEQRESQDDFMFFVDRESLQTRDFIVADGRAAQSSWFIEKTLQQYGYSYSESWYKDTKLRNIVANAGVPFGRCQKSSYGGIRSTYRSFASRQVSFEQVVQTSTIQYSYTSNTTYTQQVLSRQVQEVQQNSSYSSYSSDYNQNESYTSSGFNTHDYSTTNSSYNTSSDAYRNETTDTEYRTDYSDNRYTSETDYNSNYVDNSYSSYEKTTRDDRYEDERQSGYVQSEDNEYSYSTTNNQSSYNSRDQYGNDFQDDGYENTKYSEHSRNDSGYNEGYSNDRYEDQYENRQQYNDRY